MVARFRAPTVEDGEQRIPSLPPAEIVEVPGRGELVVRRRSAPGGSDRSTVVLVHGAGNTGDIMWFRTHELLADVADTVSFDLRGHGRGFRSDTPPSLDQLVDDVVAVSDRLELERPTLVGYSLGGVIAVAAAGARPDRFGGLVAAGTPIDAPVGRLLLGLFSARSVAVGALDLGTGVTGYARFLRTAAEADPLLRPHAAWLAGEASRTDPAYLHRLFRSMAGFDLTAMAARVTCAASVVVTNDDETVDPAGQRRLAAALEAGGRKDRGVPMFKVDAGHGAPIIAPGLFDPALRAAVGAVLNREPQEFSD